MFRKIKKLAWCTESKTLREPTTDYRFLELLVLRETESPISERLKNAGMRTERYSDYFLDQLRPLLQTPNKYIAPYLKKSFHPVLKEEELNPETAPLYKALQKPVRRRMPVPPRSQRVPASMSEDWVMVMPVPQLRCPCYPQRTYTPIVTEEEKRAVEMQKADLIFQQEILHDRRRKELRSALDHYLPGYRDASSPRPCSVPPVPNAATREVPGGIQAFERLSTPRKRLPPQSPCHAAACDAYKQGIATRGRPGKAGGARMSRRRKVVKHCWETS